MLEVFLSYSHDDLDKASVVKAELMRSDISVVSDKDVVRPGNEWRSSIDQAIKRSRAVVALMTESSTKSLYVTYEWAFSLGCGKPVLPLKFDDCDLHPRMQAIHYTDLRQAATDDWQNVSDELRKRILIDGIRNCRKDGRGTWMDLSMIKKRIDEVYTKDLIKRFEADDHRFKISTYNGGFKKLVVPLDETNERV